MPTDMYRDEFRVHAVRQVVTTIFVCRNFAYLTAKLTFSAIKCVVWVLLCRKILSDPGCAECFEVPLICRWRLTSGATSVWRPDFYLQLDFLKNDNLQFEHKIKNCKCFLEKE